MDSEESKDAATWRDEKMSMCRDRLLSRPDDELFKSLHMMKKAAADPDAVWNLKDLRDKVTNCCDNSYDAQKIPQIHGEIVGRCLLLWSTLHNHILQALKDGAAPADDPRVKDALNAVNLITLQYGIRYGIQPSGQLYGELFHNEGLGLHWLWGALPTPTSSHIYDVALSFAGEDREYVQRVAATLKEHQLRVFYDEFEQTRLWGKDLFQYLNDIYKNKARYSVLFASKHYARKSWTSHELKSMQARALQENREYILPVRLDMTEIPGLDETTAYVNAEDFSPESLAELITEKLEQS